jgi:hypothetical protein
MSVLPEPEKPKIAVFIAVPCVWDAGGKRPEVEHSRRKRGRMQGVMPRAGGRPFVSGPDLP